MEVVLPGQLAKINQRSTVSCDPVQPVRQFSILFTVLNQLPTNIPERSPFEERPDKDGPALSENVLQGACKPKVRIGVFGVDPFCVSQLTTGLPDRMAAPLEGHLLVRPHSSVTRHR